MMWNPFKKKKEEKPVDTSNVPEVSDAMIDQMLAGGSAAPKMGMMQKMALKQLKKMAPEKRKEVVARALQKFSDGGKDREKMIAEMEQMRASGQLNRQQYRAAKKRLGIE